MGLLPKRVYQQATPHSPKETATGREIYALIGHFKSNLVSSCTRPGSKPQWLRSRFVCMLNLKAWPPPWWEDQVRERTREQVWTSEEKLNKTARSLSFSLSCFFFFFYLPGVFVCDVAALISKFTVSKGENKSGTRNKDPRRDWCNYTAYVPANWTGGTPLSPPFLDRSQACKKRINGAEICWPSCIIIHKRGCVIVGTHSQCLFRKGEWMTLVITDCTITNVAATWCQGFYFFGSRVRLERIHLLHREWKHLLVHVHGVEVRRIELNAAGVKFPERTTVLVGVTSNRSLLDPHKLLPANLKLHLLMARCVSWCHFALPNDLACTTKGALQCYAAQADFGWLFMLRQCIPRSPGNRTVYEQLLTQKRGAGWLLN